MQYEEEREREHLDDEHWNTAEPPKLNRQNTQTNIKAHKIKLKIKAHKTHQTKQRNKNMIQKG